MKASDIQIRDPFILTENGTYYMYGSTDKDIWKTGYGFNMYTSRDLKEFEGPFPVFRPKDDFWGEINFWAPEVHTYNGKYYMFATFFRSDAARGTMILSADSPFGPFEPLTNRPVTPPQWDCLDGTLYVEDGVPYMIFCREWCSVPDHDGEIYCVPLTADLREPAGEPVRLFSASEAPWTKGQSFLDGAPCFVTDGPFLYKGKHHLYMLWSSFRDGYAISAAVSDRIHGPWTHFKRPIREQDSGHGMVFTDLEGTLRLTVHTPNNTPNERPIFLELTETEDGLALLQ